MGRWDYYNYTPSTPRPVKGGIKAEVKRGRAAKNWWAKQWNDVLEGFQLGARLSRGRAYARQGQVLSVEIGKGTVTAEVQGSRAKPYKVKIKVKVLSSDQWQKVTDLLAAEAIFTAKLLAGEMPADIEEVFARAGVSLFPERSHDLETDCSCPDWSNPCKHIAAVYYILGQEFDRDPFLIFKLRGMEREELISRLARTGPVDPGKGRETEAGHWAGELAEITPEPLPADPESFWAGGTVPEDLLAGTAVPSLRAALLRQAGDFPLWRGERPLLKELELMYIKEADYGLGLAAAAPERQQDTKLTPKEEMGK